MNKKELIKSEVLKCFFDWESTFKVEVTEDDYDEDGFDVELTYQWGHWSMPHIFNFNARVEENGTVTYCRYEDVYENLSELEIFQWLFFEMTTRIEKVSSTKGACGEGNE